MMHGKAIWELGISELAKDSKDNATAGLNKTQSYMKSGGQQKCLDKGLYIYIYIYICISLQYNYSS